MSNSPCGGCPPHCSQCVFDARPQQSVLLEIISPATEYGCIKGHGDLVKDHNGRLGQMRGQDFHPMTLEGERHLRTTGNKFARHL